MKAIETKLISAMPDLELTAVWSVLETEARGDDPGIEAAPSGVVVSAGEALLGVDSLGRRHLLIPLQAGEAFAEDRTGRSVHLVKIEHGATTYLSAVGLQSDLDEVFAQFCSELLDDIRDATSPAQATVTALDRWRRLFSEADGSGLLSEPRLIGLLAELLMVESLVALDPSRRIGVWTGPSGSQHDLRAGQSAVEVKGTLAREGRIVQISSIDQLAPPPGGTLHLAHYRFELDPKGESTPAVIERILDLGVEQTALADLLQLVGYRMAHSAHYGDRRYRVTDLRVYDVEGVAFPRIVPATFVGGQVPPGTMKISYAVDLSNEPPIPLDADAVTALLGQMAGG